MAYLLSTETLIALLKPEPESHPVIQWKRTVSNTQVFVSVISLGEIHDAVERLEPSQALVRDAWLKRLDEHVPRVFFGRILPIDQRVARAWSGLRRAGGDELSTEQALVLATARANGYTLLGRELPFYRSLGIPFHDPYLAPRSLEREAGLTAVPREPEN